MGHIWFRFPSILPQISPQGHPHSAREVRRPTKLFIVPARQRRSARGVGDFPRGRPPRFFLGGVVLNMWNCLGLVFWSFVVVEGRLVI